MNQPNGHLSEERIQAFLDGALLADERDAVHGHLDGCDRCRARVRGWQGLFARLEALPELSPSPGFAEGVMEEVPTAEPLAARLRRWIAGLLPEPRPLDGHLDPGMVLSYLDGVLPRRRRARVEGHLDGCAACRDEVAEWRHVFRELEGLERLAPSEGFADTVMSRVRTRERVPVEPDTEWSDRLVGWIERLRPRTRKAWTLAGSAAAAPAMALLTGALALFTSNPLLTPSNLATFLWWETSAAATTLAGGAAQRVMESPILFRIWEAVQALAESPTLAAAGGVAFSAATLAALWILYRNLISTPTVERGYANLSA